MTTEEILRTIKEEEEMVVADMLKSIVMDLRHDKGKQAEKLWERYKLKNVPIYHRTPASYEKIDRRTANDFYADIVDTKVGYMGNEISVMLDRDVYESEEEYDKESDFMRRHLIESESEDENSEQLRLSGACGVSYRLLYVPEGKNQIRMMRLKPWEVAYFVDASIDEPQVAFHVYTMDEYSNGLKTKEITKVEWYDDREIKYYTDNGDLKFFRDTERYNEGVQPHLFNGVPVFEFPNNELRTGEPEKVTDLIDTYDAIISSTSSEVEQLRLAYMYIKGQGLSIDSAYIKQLEQTGIFALDENGEVGFVDKRVAIEGVQILLDILRKNIYQFAKSIDMSKDFGGDMRVIGWQVALLNLENSCKITERKFKRALRMQYKLITAYWKKYTGVDIDPYTIDFVFTRNFPRDLHSEAETLNLLLMAVSKQTAFSQMSFIDDPDKELARIENEQDPYRGVDGDQRPEEEPTEQPEETPRPA